MGSINGVFPKIHERAKSIHLTKIYENDNVAKNGSKIVAGNQGAVCSNWVENSELARFNLWSKNKKRIAVKKPTHNKDRLGEFDLFLEIGLYLLEIQKSYFQIFAYYLDFSISLASFLFFTPSLSFYSKLIPSRLKI